MNGHSSRRKFLGQCAGLVAGGLGAGGLVDACHALPVDPAPIRAYRRGGMLYRRLGHTDLFISALSFGSHTNPTYRVATDYGSMLNDEGQARRDRHIAKALDQGVNMVDVYENAGQWQPMARMVKPKREKVLISICRQTDQLVSQHIDAAARLFGHVDLYRIYLGDGPRVDDSILEQWDAIRRARKTGKVRAIGVAVHLESMMLSALDELEGLDYIMFPYNFIHARADYSQFLPRAIEKGVGLIAIKPLAAGSIAKLDPRARPGSQPEDSRILLYKKANRPVLPAVVKKLTENLDRMPNESLCQAAMRFVYSRPFIATAMPGMFQEHELDENYAAILRHLELSRNENDALNAARRLSGAWGSTWLPRHYRWLDHCWRTS
ncbi:MAG: hypothetical protein CMJ21_05225 [Phycisphaerae bacterium]|nr:hypothetical protein [Phycisphaerae bacterium]